MKRLLLKLGLLILVGTFLSSTSPATVRYVDLNSATPTPPYTNWITAATNIQDAVSVAEVGDTVLVTDGIYSNGGAVVYGQETNRVALTNAITLLSVDGPQVTAIVGGIQTRCAYVGTNAVLSGFTLVSGQTRSSGDSVKERSGGGVWCEASGVVMNCLIVSNSASVNGGNGGGAYGGIFSNCSLIYNSARNGGGAYQSTLTNCIISSNSAISGHGGGVYTATLHNCTLTGNSDSGDSGTGGGGGARASTLYNCTLTGNRSVWGEGGGAYLSTLYNCTLIGNSGFYEGGGGAGSSTLYNSILKNNDAWHNGGGTYNCTNYNCTIASNVAYTGEGGGAELGRLYNCVLSGNRARNGGGASGGTLYNCTLTGNLATNFGGGALYSTLFNCTLTGNTASNSGGGTYYGTLNNCIIYYNSASNWFGGTFYSCCTIPLPTVFNQVSPPLFVNQANGNLRLQTNSPCINKGENFWVTNSTDIDGRPRIVGGTVDIGAYEFQAPSMGEFIGWLQQYGLPTSGSADFTDPDQDGADNWHEWRADTIPTNSASALRMLSPAGGVSDLTVSWESVSTRSYWVERATNFVAQPAFSSVATNVAGQSGTTSYTDTNAAGDGPFFYRVGVQ